MKIICMILIAIFSFAMLGAQTVEPTYNPELAASLGADDYGMKSYIFVILKTGDAVIGDKEKVDSLFQGHMKNIAHLAEAGKLIVAGPFGKNDLTFRGLYIFDLSPEDRIEDLLDMDPAIKAGLLEPVVLPWYGAAALPTYKEVQEQITKVKF